MTTPAFSIKAADLVRAMARVSGAIPSRATIPILNHVEIAAGAGEITIRATSLDIEAMTSVEADVQRPGSTTVHGQMLASIASKLPKSGAITVAVADGVAKLTCGRSSYDLATLPAEDFPQFKALDNDASTIVIDAAALKAAIGATIGSTSTDASNFAMCGISISTPKSNDGKMLAVATDRHELVKVTTQASGALPAGVIIPVAAAKLIKDIADDGGVTISTDGSRIVATAGANTIGASLIEGTYPDYERVIPRINGAFATVIADDLSGAADRAMAVFTGANVLGSRIAITTGPDGIEIAAAGPSNRALEHVEGDCTKHAFACDGTRLRGLLAQWGEKPIMLQQDAPGGPILIRSDAEPSVIQVLMPMK